MGLVLVTGGPPQQIAAGAEVQCCKQGLGPKVILRLDVVIDLPNRWTTAIARIDDIHRLEAVRHPLVGERDGAVGA